MSFLKNKIINLNRYTALNFSTKTYTRFWNLIFSILNNPVRFRALDDDNMFIEDREYELYISQKLRAWFYFKSIKNRFETLGKMYFFDKIEFSDDNIIVDCGSNIGEIFYSLKIFNKNKFDYYGFEPVDSEFNLLQLNPENNIQSPIALFDKNEIRKLYVHKEGADSTLFEDIRYNAGTNVQCRRLDSIDILKNKNIKLLKLEAEGCELEVLMGCGNILKNIEYISADIGYELDQGTKSNEKEVTEFLLQNNFRHLDINDRRVNLFRNIEYIT